MSDIPEARRLIKKALRLMDREKPAFRHRREVSKLTRAQRKRARELRAEGWSLLQIARSLRTNHGRISEAINEKPKRRY
jgi:DNA invertase Pin-like site-specific DNA recombinase